MSWTKADAKTENGKTITYWQCATCGVWVQTNGQRPGKCPVCEAEEEKNESNT